MNRKLVLVLTIICLLLVSGCTSYNPSIKVYFDDTGNNVENDMICNQKCTIDNNYLTFDEPVCEEGKCVCICKYI